MADGWTDQKRRTLINFLVYCPKGTIFFPCKRAGNRRPRTGNQLRFFLSCRSTFSFPSSVWFRRKLLIVLDALPGMKW